MATLHAFDGFEHGPATLVAGTGPDQLTGTVVTVTSPVRTGTRALEISPAGAAERAGYGTSGRTVTMAFYLRFAALPGSTQYIAYFTNSPGDGRLYYDTTSGKLVAQAVGGGDVAGGPVIAVDTWYRVVCEYDTSTTSYVLRVKVDDTDVFQNTERTVGTAADTTAANIGNAGAVTFTEYIDDWVVSITDGDFEEMCGWLSHRVESLIPNSDGTHNITTSGDFDSFTGTAFSNATTNGNTFIAHRPLQRANTANQVIRQELGTTANYMEFGNENLSNNADAVDGVRTYATHIESAASGASLGEARLLLSDDTEVLTTGSLSVINSTEDPGTTVTTRDRAAIAPSGGWDGTKVDGLKWRIGFADNAPDVNFIDLMVEVAQHVTGVTGVTLTATPSLPTGEVQEAGGGPLTVTGDDADTITATPSLPTGNAGASQVLGVVVTATPSLPTGNAGASQVLGTVLTATPSLPTGNAGASQVLGTVLTATPSLPTGSLTSGDITVTAVVLTVTPSLPTGTVGLGGVLGVELIITPSLPTGSVTGGLIVVPPQLIYPFNDPLKHGKSRRYKWRHGLL